MNEGGRYRWCSRRGRLLARAQTKLDAVGEAEWERCVNRLKQRRGIATRYEKWAVNYRAMVIIAALVIWLAE